nr:hypothetical protein [Providencia stuartii]
MSKLKPKSQSLPIINPNAAGIDIGGRFHVVAVPPDRSDKSVRTFKAFIGDIHNMARWLAERMIRANIAVDDDVNVLIQNEYWLFPVLIIGLLFQA